MIRREVTLRTGLKIGNDQALIAEIREETLDDELTALEKGLTGDALSRFISMRRVAKIGSLADPDPAILRKLTRVDWDLIEVKLAALDVELAVEAGLIPATGGRDAPGADEPEGAAAGNA